eukprot:6375871-Amphidinium_carterae.2
MAGPLLQLARSTASETTGAEDLMTIAINRHGSSSVERALMHCSEEDVECLVGQLLQCDVLELAQSQSRTEMFVSLP